MRGLLLAAVLLAGSVLGADRVSDARARRSGDVKALIEKAGLTAAPSEVYLRVFKREKQLELWAGPRDKPLSLVKTYAICAASGALGPKRIEGDEQVPEGFYEVTEFNSTSNFHLSMKVSYPNASDRVRSDRRTPGGLIYVHGNCVSIGCVAIEDRQIEEVYLLSLDAKVRRIDLFPFRMTVEAMERVKESNQFDFWSELEPGFTQFEKTKRPATYTVDAKTGVYRVKI